MKRRALFSKVPIAAIALTAMSYKLTNNLQELPLKQEVHSKNCNCETCLPPSSVKPSSFEQGI